MPKYSQIASRATSVIARHLTKHKKVAEKGPLLRKLEAKAFERFKGFQSSANLNKPDISDFTTNKLR